jgi:hypothetical protein
MQHPEEGEQFASSLLLLRTNSTAPRATATFTSKCLITSRPSRAWWTAGSGQRRWWDNCSFTRESSDGKSLTTQQLRWALPLEAEAAALAAVLNTAMVRRQSELEGEQRRLGEHGGALTRNAPLVL